MPRASRSSPRRSGAASAADIRRRHAGRTACATASRRSRAEGAPDIVLIQDAARPFADAALVARAIEAARDPWRRRPRRAARRYGKADRRRRRRRRRRPTARGSAPCRRRSPFASISFSTAHRAAAAGGRELYRRRHDRRSRRRHASIFSKATPPISSSRRGGFRPRHGAVEATRIRRSARHPHGSGL